jgi:hypothetical protein
LALAGIGDVSGPPCGSKGVGNAVYSVTTRTRG